MTTAEVLQKARDLIADEDRWTHGYYARDEEGFEVEPNEPGACQWCALGSIYHVLGAEVVYAEEEPDAVRALNATAAAGGSADNPAYINDINGHAAVLALFDKAIAAGAA